VTDLLTLPSFAADDTFYVVVESPRGSTSKLKYDVNRRVMTLSRPLPQGLAYPHDWGFIPSTRAPDGDPLDAIIVWDGVSYPGITVECRLIGLLQVEQTRAASQQRERNDRLIALPTKAPRWEPIRTVFDLGERVRLDLEFFFQAAVTFEGKALKILGWDGPKGAMALVRAAAANVK
jgi:inorganic pyrophosphatase